MKCKFSIVAARVAVLFAVHLTACRTPAADRTGAGYGGADKILVPNKGWPCGMPERGVPVFEATMKLDQVHDLGKTPYGPRTVYVTQEGSVTGGRLQGSVMAGGLDFELNFASGAREIEELLVLRATNGISIYLHNLGTAADPADVRVVPEFEAPNGSAYQRLNTGKYAGRRVVDPVARTLKLILFDVSTLAVAADAANSVRVIKPAEVKDRPVDFRRAKPGGRRGGQLVSENVTLAASQRVGSARNRNRNIIPITGGTLTGKITGKVLAGGADYQALANPMTIDARYLWQTGDGEVIIVRNAGPIMSLAPTFEVGVDSQYAWLNQGTCLSASPGMGAGGVGLTFYESAQ